MVASSSVQIVALVGLVSLGIVLAISAYLHIHEVARRIGRGGSLQELAPPIVFALLCLGFLTLEVHLVFGILRQVVSAPT